MKKILIIVLAVGILFGGGMLVVFLGNVKKTPRIDKSPTPTQTPQQQDTTRPAVQYDKEATDKLLLNVTTRPTPAISDKTIRQEIIDELLGNSGIVNKTNTYIIEYSKAPDSFSVEIKTTNAEAAKQSAISYLRSRGLSDDGICKLPLFFYLDYSASQAFRNSGQIFSPIPDFCK